MTQTFSVAFSSVVANELFQHLIRDDGQEDLCFAVWHRSEGARRVTATIREVVLPTDGERQVHGNVSFNSEYFMRAADLAAQVGGGLAILHSHPRGKGWQTLSDDDIAAEAGHAGRAQALTEHPLIGLTLGGGDKGFSARKWIRTGTRTYEPRWALSVRTVGDRWAASWNPSQWDHRETPSQDRTIATWGNNVQLTLSQLHVGVVGVGSVGSLVVEALARIGVGRLRLIDFDTVKVRNLDRIVNSRRIDAAIASTKADVAARAAERAATYPLFECSVVDASVVEPEGLSAALDCDILFSCVDRPGARAALNAMAYAHLIPVIDGGVLVDSTGSRLRAAQWRSHVAAPGRRCMECLGQYDAGLVQSDRDGLLDDPSYLARLPERHALRRGENVFAFSAAAASAEIIAALRMIVAPGGYADAGAQHTHFTTGDTDTDLRTCEPTCPYPAMTAFGDDSGLPIASRHVAAEKERGLRERSRSRPIVRILRAADSVAFKLERVLDRLAVTALSRKDR